MTKSKVDTRLHVIFCSPPGYGMSFYSMGFPEVEYKDEDKEQDDPKDH